MLYNSHQFSMVLNRVRCIEPSESHQAAGVEPPMLGVYRVMVTEAAQGFSVLAGPRPPAGVAATVMPLGSPIEIRTHWTGETPELLNMINPTTTFSLGPLEESAFQDLLENHLPVRSIVERMKRKLPSNVETEDFYSIGVTGLAAAARNYRPSGERGV